MKNIPKVSNFDGVKNQFIIRNSNGITYLQSYDSIILMRDSHGKITLDERYWKYSNTTSKYRNRFLSETTKVTERKINDGIYMLDNLN